MDTLTFQVRYDYAELLGLHVDDGERKRFSTATGALEAHGHFVTLPCFGYEFESKVFFSVEEGLPRNVLGRQGGWIGFGSAWFTMTDRSF